MSPFVATLALVGVVIIVAALLSGLADRVRLPQVALFLALGAALGPAGLDLVDFALTSPVLQSIATLALVLVLFTDAVAVDLRAVRANARLAFLVLGPGTLLTALLLTVAAWVVLDLPPALAAVLGAALASTDPVMVRGLLRGPDLPDDARLALRLESGLNDLVLL
ncbi:MAG: cation:proton antiporter, partial [Gemmatimonadales bacterium]